MTKPTPMLLAPLCYFCWRPMRFAEAHIVLHDGATDGAPSIDHPYRTEVELVCDRDDCIRDGVRFSFADLVDRSLFGERGVISHLLTQPWFNQDRVIRLHEFYDLAARMRDAEPEHDRIQALIGLRVSRGKAKPTPPARMLSPRTRALVMERDAFRCRRCGAGPKDAQLVVDHIHPVAKGGGRELGNLQTLCHPCNAGKRDRDPHDHDKGATT